MAWHWVLLNAIYFKASWFTPFDASLTAPGVFHAPGGDATADVMHGVADTYAAGDGLQAVALPYISPAVSMLLIVPDAGRFDEIEATLDRELFDDVQGALTSAYAVELALPKFRIEGASGQILFVGRVVDPS